jgi:hypothetical protein
MVRRTILTAICVASAFGAPSANALIVSAEPAWNGWVQPGTPTEVAVRVVGDRGGLLQLTLVDRSITYTHSTDLEANVGFVWRVPLAPPSGDPLQLRVQVDEEPAVEQAITLRRHLASSPLLAVVADRPIALDGIEATAIHVTGDSLPFHDSSFAAMDLVVIHRDSLQGMAGEQLIALRQHAARCGRIVTVDFAPATITQYAEFAGCGGRYLVSAQTGTDLDARVAGLLQAPVPQLPSPGSLRGLLSGDGLAKRITPLVVFFTVYLCVLLFAVRSRRPSLYFASASIAASLIGLAAWTMSPEQVDRVTWTEVNNHAAAARFISVMTVLGGGDRVTIEVPVSAGPLQALQPVNLLVASSFSGGANATVSFDVRLLSKHEFVATGVTAIPPPLTVEHAGEVPRIINTGADMSPPALLAWNDLKYSVPPLTPNEDWRPPSEPEPWGAGRAERLFRLRAMNETAALLLEYPSRNRQPANAARNYLMVRP